MDNEYLLLSGSLSVFNDFSKSGCENFAIEHDTKNPKLELLLEQYSFEGIAGNGNNFSSVRIDEKATVQF